MEEVSCFSVGMAIITGENHKGYFLKQGVIETFIIYTGYFSE